LSDLPLALFVMEVVAAFFGFLIFLDLLGEVFSLVLELVWVERRRILLLLVGLVVLFLEVHSPGHEPEGRVSFSGVYSVEGSLHWAFLQVNYISKFLRWDMILLAEAEGAARKLRRPLLG